LFSFCLLNANDISNGTWKPGKGMATTLLTTSGALSQSPSTAEELCSSIQLYLTFTQFLLTSFVCCIFMAETEMTYWQNNIQLNLGSLKAKGVALRLGTRPSWAAYHHSTFASVVNNVGSFWHNNNTDAI
jgi:hypothetical protein